MSGFYMRILSTVWGSTLYLRAHFGRSRLPACFAPFRPQYVPGLLNIKRELCEWSDWDALNAVVRAVCFRHLRGGRSVAESVPGAVLAEREGWPLAAGGCCDPLLYLRTWRPPWSRRARRASGQTRASLALSSVRGCRAFVCSRRGAGCAIRSSVPRTWRTACR